MKSPGPAIDVEVHLRIPAVKDPPHDDKGYPINSAHVRFIRSTSVPTLPQPGAVLNLATKDGPLIACEVDHADWSEGRDRFIVYCKYAKRSIPADEYYALLNDPGWEMRPLL